MEIPSPQDIADQFVNEDRTRIDTPGAYPQMRIAAQELVDRLNRIPTPAAGLMCGQILWYRDEFAKWGPENEPSEEKRSRIVTEFLQLFRDYRLLLDEFEKAIKPVLASKNL